MSYLELPHFFAVAANTVGNGAGNTATVATPESMAEADGQPMATTSFSQWLQKGETKIMEAAMDAMVSVADSAVESHDSHTELLTADSVSILNAGLVVGDLAMIGQAGAGENQVSDPHGTMVQTDTDSELDVNTTEAIWPGLALFMDSRAALNGADAAQLNSSITMAETGNDSIAHLIRAQIAEPDGRSASVWMTDNLPASGSSADAVVATTEKNGGFPLQPNSLMTGVIAEGMELSPGSIAMTALSSSPTVLSVSLPDPSNLSLTGVGTPTVEGVKLLPLASADGVIQNAVPPVVPLTDLSARISLIAAEGVKPLPLVSADGAIQNAVLPMVATEGVKPLPLVSADGAIQNAVLPIVAAEGVKSLPLVSANGVVQNAVPPTAEIMNPLATIGTTTTTETPEIEAAGEAIAKPLDRILMSLKAQGSGLGLTLPTNANSQSAATVVVENSVDVVSQDRAVAHLGVFRLGNELLSWRQTNLSSGMVVNPVVTQPTDSTLQMPADELTPVPVLVNVVRENSTRSDHSISITQNLSATVAAPIARPQLADELDSVGLHLENALQDSTVVRGVVEPTSPARGSGLAPTPVILTALSRPEAVTSPTFPSSISDVLDFQQSHWERTLGQQLNWMVNNRVHEASIRVNPPDLGPIEVRVSLQQNQTNVTFFSHEAAVREAIENAMPRLREMLGSQGIALNQALVSDQSLARQQAGFGEQPQERRGNGSVLGTPDQNSVNDEVDRQPHSRRLLGMVDHYV